MPSGELRERFSFYAEGAEQSGAFGLKKGALEKQFTVWGKLVPRFGSEAVAAARLQGRQPYTLTVRNTSQTRQVTTDWTVTRERDGVSYNIRTIADPDQKRAWFEMLVEAGVAT